MKKFKTSNLTFDLHSVEEEDHWISVSDLMAGLMMVFLFIAVALMRDAFQERDKVTEIAITYQENQVAIYDKLIAEFGSDLPLWDAEIKKETLSFEFQSPEVLFDSGQIRIKQRFKGILDDFFPRYLGVLKGFQQSINEIRIEGHTSSIWGSSTGLDIAYFKNMELSQGRTRSVLQYVYLLDEVAGERPWVKKYIAAVGFSSAHPVLDGDDKEDPSRSRRVSFRIIPMRKYKSARYWQNSVMPLNVSFDELYAAVKRMGAPIVEDFTINIDMDAVDTIDLNLQKGLEVKLDDVSFENGLISHQRRQILLYIQDQGRRVEQVKSNGAKGRKYHVTNCRTLKEMRRINRYERYVATNDISGSFFVSGKDRYTSEDITGKAELKVCKNCLKKLNYQGFATNEDGSVAIFSKFTLEKFFATYSSFFPYIPKRFAGPTSTDSYPNDWKDTSREYRTKQNFICENCHLNLSEKQRLLHTHHISGVKTDNHHSNLMALCVDCHSKQPCHGHMFVSRNDRQTIVRLQRKQGKLDTRTWDKVIKFADPGVEGLALKCKQSNLPTPEVGYEIGGSDDSVTMLALAWKDRKVGIAIDSASANRENLEGWKIWTVADALDDDQFYKFRRQIINGY